jgi:dipeptide/tripeptide permease
MCADQVPKEDYVVTKDGVEYIVDHDLSVQTVYNWFYWAINIGGLVGTFICTNILEPRGFWLAYLFPACMFVLAVVVFAVGYRSYIHVAPEGSIYTKALSCMRYAIKRQKYIEHSRVHIPAGTSFAFLEFAKPVLGESKEDINARKWTSDFPLELRNALKACSIFPLMTIYWVCYRQMTNNLVTQAGEMAIPFWLKNDLVAIIDVSNNLIFSLYV